MDTLTRNGVTWTYEYNADGLRTARTSDTKDYFYVYNGTQLTQVTIVDNSVTPNATTVIDLGYDAAGTPLTLTIDGETYYYLTNIQGDVMGVIDESGVRHVSYFYDGFGRSYFLANTDDGDMISSIDPLGYRGYLLDNGTGLYYLQSRSYNPKVGRFINADAFVSTGQGVLGNNMFAYCNNNPIMLLDRDGCTPDEAVDLDGDGEIDYYVYTYTYTGIFPWSPETSGKVYIYTNLKSEAAFDSLTLPEDFNPTTDALVGDWTHGENATMYVHQAQNIKSKYRPQITEILFVYVEDFDKTWERTKESVLTEWREHHRYSPFSSRAKNVSFDEAEEGGNFIYFFFKGVSGLLDKLLGGL